MSDNEFSDKIQKSMEGTKEDLQTVKSRIKNPKYHEQRVGTALKSAITDLKSMDGEVNMIQELLSIIDQVPYFVGAGWAENERLERHLEAKLDVWKDVEKQFADHQTEEVRQEEELQTTIERQKELVSKVESGEISEPTVISSIRRKSGTRPESLANIRKATAAVKELEEQSSNDSEG